MLKYILPFLLSFTILASDDFVIVEGDIALKKSEDKSSFLRSASKWMGGVIPWIIDPADMENTSLKVAVKAAMDLLNKHTNLVFKNKNPNDKNYLVFTSKNEGCYSFIGMQGGAQEINLATGCHHQMIVAHEILHAVGFEHEQSREDRDDYLVINWENIKDNQKHNFAKVQRSNLGPYNFDSIMHYGSYSFSKNGKPTMTTRSGTVFKQNLTFLSPGDQEAVNTLYPIKSVFDLSRVSLDFEQNGRDQTFVQVKADPEIIKSIQSLTYKINNSEVSHEISSWDNNFRYSFETKKGRNVVHVNYNLRDGSKEESDYVYFYIGKKLSVECDLTVRRESIKFVVPISYEGEQIAEENRESRNYFSKVSAIFNPSTGTLDLNMTLGREKGIIRRENKEEETFSIIESGSHSLVVERAELVCTAINEEI